MPFRWNPGDHISHVRYGLRWLVLASPVGLVVGSACAFFLWSLDKVTAARVDYGWLLFLLPLAGMVIGWTYHRWGKPVEAGNNLIVDEIHKPGGGVPRRMAPLVLFGTLVTHLFGGSAGREGTAVQMGGSIASYLGSLLGTLPAHDRKTLLMAGVAAGFGGVFGTPLAGAVFAIEVLSIGRMSYGAVIPCLIASIVSDWACGAWGIHHTAYVFPLLRDEGGLRHLDWLLLAKTALAAVTFGWVAHLFAELVHGLGRVFKWVTSSAVLRPALGGVLVIGLTYALGTRDYLGLGVTSSNPEAVTILSCFHQGGATTWSWWWKILFTAVTLSAGFKGGEVTPLFFIGAALGNTLAWLLGAPVELFAALGFVAVFAGATNTPLACTIMAVELFGTHHVVYFAVACFGAYLFSGHNGIYLSQVIGTPKADTGEELTDAQLRAARDLTPQLTELPVFSGVNNNSLTPLGESQGESIMTKKKHRLVSREIGAVRIYLTQGEKREQSGWKAMFSKPLYQEIIDAAKADGLMNALTHYTHYGYSGHGKTRRWHPELPNTHMSLYVEIIDHRDRLEAFCKLHGDLLKDRVVIYKHVEHWDIDDHAGESHESGPTEAKQEG